MQQTNRSRLDVLPLAFGVTIFLSAFLLFLVQPLISKIILPWFGGSTGVWATCLVFFQSMLCLGYAYAHFTQSLPIVTQRWVHWILLVLAIVSLPVMPPESWKPVDGNAPTLRIFVILLLKTGLPYLALSATGPLLQAWHARLFPESRTYRLYALSNVASLASLLLFPVWFERAMTSNSLSTVWSILFVLFVLGCGFVAYRVSISSPVPPLQTAAHELAADSSVVEPVVPAPGLKDYFLWLALPGFASFLLVAGTNHLCQDIASTPFLWILPLCLYLLSFILCFDAPRWYARRFYVVLGLMGLYGIIAMRDLDDTEQLRQGWLVNGVLPILAPILHALDWYTPAASSTDWATWLESQVQRGDLHIDLIGQIALHGLALFAVFMVCHGELVRCKPAPRYLTAFYLMISIGGAIGSALVSLAAPALFPDIWEWLMGLTISVMIFCGLLFSWSAKGENPAALRKEVAYFVIPSLVVLGVVLWQSSILPLTLANWIRGEATWGEPLLATDILGGSEDFEGNERPLNPFPNHLLRLPACLIAIAGWLAVTILAVWGYLRGSSSRLGPRWLALNFIALGLSIVYLRDIYSFAAEDLKEVWSGQPASNDTAWRDRNFYGALTIAEYVDVADTMETYRSLYHGRIVHGTQYVDGPKRAKPTTYYPNDSGVGIALEHVSHRDKVRMGAIGLGTGTLAAYAAPIWSDELGGISPNLSSADYHLTIYEINPLVVSLSEGETPWFSYVQDARARGAQVDIVLGDARLMMERQDPQQFDVLAVDAFSGDSIPTHLLTDEAMQIYHRHLRPDGILAIHISNRYLDLEPICKALAKRHGYEARAVEAESVDDGYSSTWVLLTKDASLTLRLDDTVDGSRLLSRKQSILWTDAFSSLYEVLMDSDFDDDIDVIEASAWGKKLIAENPDVEFKKHPRWWRDGWTYCRTWPADASSPYEIRVDGGKIQVKPLGQSEATWQQVE